MAARFHEADEFLVVTDQVLETIVAEPWRDEYCKGLANFTTCRGGADDIVLGWYPAQRVLTCTVVAGRRNTRFVDVAVYASESGAGVDGPQATPGAEDIVQQGVRWRDRYRCASLQDDA